MAKSRPQASTRDRLVDAAAAAFAARGFDGTTVDSIAARARINKAMLYYHYPSKAALYREILAEMFRSVAASVDRIRATDRTPEAQVRAFVDAVAEQAQAHPHFASMWLREMAEGGRHLDESIVLEMRRVLVTLATIVVDGQKAGAFGDADPLVIQIGIVAPLLFFLASAPIRQRFRHLKSDRLAPPDFDTVVAHVKTTTLARLAVGRRAADPAARSPHS